MKGLVFPPWRHVSLALGVAPGPQRALEAIDGPRPITWLGQNVKNFSIVPGVIHVEVLSVSYVGALRAKLIDAHARALRRLLSPTELFGRLTQVHLLPMVV